MVDLVAVERIRGTGNLSPAVAACSGVAFRQYREGLGRSGKDSFKFSRTAAREGWSSQ